jgi:DNA polymerase sigma
MKEDLDSKDKKMMSLLNEISELKRVNDILQKSIKVHQEEKEKFVSIYQSKCEKLEKENKDLNLKMEKYVKNDIFQQKSTSLSRDEYLERKYSLNKFDENYSAACLHKDILDFQDLIKKNIKDLKPTQEELIELVKESVSECIEDYEVLVYGSYATKLCLPWSDIDLVLIPKVNVTLNQYTVLKHLTINLQVIIYF